MNRSFSKIRHIQESNQRLEQRLLGEQSLSDMNTPSVVSKDYLFLVSAGGMSKVFPVMVKKDSKINKMGTKVSVSALEGALSSNPEVGGKIPPASTFKPSCEVYLNCMDKSLYVKGTKSSSMIETEGREIDDPNSQKLKSELIKFCKK